MRALCLLVLCLSCAAPTEKRAGGQCTGKDYECTSDGTMLICQDGVFVEYPCRGPHACREEDSIFSCDQTVAAEGDRCQDVQEGAFACNTDGTAKLQCTGGVFERRGECPGCYLDENIEIACRWRPGDACVAPQFGCADSATAMECVGNVLQTAPCMGPRGCGIRGVAMDCDATIARSLDTCLSDGEGEASCSTDGHQLLRCHNRRWDVERICSRCTVEGSRALCE